MSASSGASTERLTCSVLDLVPELDSDASMKLFSLRPGDSRPTPLTQALPHAAVFPSSVVHALQGLPWGWGLGCHLRAVAGSALNSFPGGRVVGLSDAAGSLTLPFLVGKKGAVIPKASGQSRRHGVMAHPGAPCLCCWTPWRRHWQSQFAAGTHSRGGRTGQLLGPPWRGWVLIPSPGPLSIAIWGWYPGPWSWRAANGLPGRQGRGLRPQRAVRAPLDASLGPK